MIGNVGSISPMLGRMRAAGWTPAAAGASLLSWMRGDDPGAAINTTPTPHQYAAIPDRGALGGQLEQATSGSQPQASTLWTPGPAPLFSGGRRLIHSVPAAALAALSDGTTDVRGGIVFRANGDVTTAHHLGTFNNSAANIGFLLHAGSDGTARLSAGNGSGAMALSLSANALSGNTTHIVTWDKIGANVALRVDKVQVAGGTIASPVATAPQHTLTLGAANSGAVPTVGWIPEVVIFAGADLPGLDVIEDYLSRWSYTP